MEGYEKRYTYIIKLDGCHHTPQFRMSPPMKGDVITCLYCRKPRKVIARRTCYWEARCKTCPWSRSSGMVRRDAIDYAEKHATKNNHIVEVWSPEVRLHCTRHPKGEQLTFGNTVTERRFTATRPHTMTTVASLDNYDGG